MIDANSNWELTKQSSEYHFDNNKFDPKWDRVNLLGKIDKTWNSDDIKNIINSSEPKNMENRGRRGNNLINPNQLATEEYDLKRAGIDPKTIITNMSWDIPKKFLEISEKFCLDNVSTRLIISKPGQMWSQHIDKLHNWFPEDPDRIVRIFIQLTDWEQGQFWSFGNAMWTHWKAGDVVTFDWKNLPHATANASWDTRVTLQLTGLMTEKTTEYLKCLKES